MLHGDDVASRGDQAGRAEVLEVVQPHGVGAGGRACSAPAVPDRVLVQRGGPFAGIEPAAGAAQVSGHVGGERLDQPLGSTDGALAAVLRRTDLDQAPVSELNLPLDADRAPQEVDVSDTCALPCASSRVVRSTPRFSDEPAAGGRGS